MSSKQCMCMTSKTNLLLNDVHSLSLRHQSEIACQPFLQKAAMVHQHRLGREPCCRPTKAAPVKRRLLSTRRCPRDSNLACTTTSQPSQSSAVVTFQVSLRFHSCLLSCRMCPLHGVQRVVQSFTARISYLGSRKWCWDVAP